MESTGHGFPGKILGDIFFKSVFIIIERISNFRKGLAADKDELADRIHEYCSSRSVQWASENARKLNSQLLKILFRR
ncbi:hypothetical protein [Peribacillus sp. NPDC096540]|uniref:hypothetical protein n=1 Tax=Peribacillus sp. NPDC096540 TaxID=3390612 RepID=UPI003D084CB0